MVCMPDPHSEPEELHMLYNHVSCIAVVVNEVQSDLVGIAPFDSVRLIGAATLCHEGVQYLERGKLAHLHCPGASGTQTTLYSHLSDSMPLPERVVYPLIPRFTFCGIPAIPLLPQSVLRPIITTIIL